MQVAKNAEQQNAENHATKTNSVIKVNESKQIIPFVSGNSLRNKRMIEDGLKTNKTIASKPSELLNVKEALKNINVIASKPPEHLNVKDGLKSNNSMASKQPKLLNVKENLKSNDAIALMPLELLNVSQRGTTALRRMSLQNFPSDETSQDRSLFTVEEGRANQTRPGLSLV